MRRGNESVVYGLFFPSDVRRNRVWRCISVRKRDRSCRADVRRRHHGSQIANRTHRFHQKSLFEPALANYSMSLPIALYIPNLLGYARIVSAFVGLHFAETHPRLAVGTWIFSASLDLLDGALARALNQTSSLGILLDIVADNILRTTIWIAAAHTDGLRLQACLVISLEWITMLSTQLHATQSGSHWKSSQEKDPWIVRAVFANNFRGPLGIWTIYGLFSCGLFLYLVPHREHFEMIPFFDALKYLAYSGRMISAYVEIWLTLGYLRLVIDRDTKKSEKDS